MQTTLINHPKLHVFLRTGSEGPAHDPYSFKEFTVSTLTDTVVLHEGLAEYIEVNGRRVQPPEFIGRAKLEWSAREKVEHAWREDMLRQTIGYSRAQLERIMRKRQACCACGSRRFHEESGYPGETFRICDQCGRVSDSYFCESAVM